MIKAVTEAHKSTLFMDDISAKVLEKQTEEFLVCIYENTRKGINIRILKKYNDCRSLWKLSVTKLFSCSERFLP